MALNNKLIPLPEEDSKKVDVTEKCYEGISDDEFAVLVAAGFEQDDIEEIIGSKFGDDKHSTMILNGRKLLTRKVLTALVNMATGHKVVTERYIYKAEPGTSRNILQGKEVKITTIPPSESAGKFLLANITNLTQDPVKNKLLKHKIQEIC